MPYSSFPKLDAEVHPSKPSDGQESLLPESIDCILSRESSWSWLKKLPALTTSVSWGTIGDCFPPQRFLQDYQGHWGALLLQGCLRPDLTPVLSGPMISCQRCILTVLSWKSVLYTTLRAFTNNPVISFLFFFFSWERYSEVMELLIFFFSKKSFSKKKSYVFLMQWILKFIFNILKYLNYVVL